MEIFFLAILVVLVDRIARKDNIVTAPTICVYCDRGVHWTGRQWVHDDGEMYHRLGTTSAMHPAIPDRSFALEP